MLSLDGKRILLYGVDAPVRGQPCYAGTKTWDCATASAKTLLNLVGDQEITCEQRRIDQFGRVFAICKAGEVDINRALVEAGMAVALPKETTDYVAAEAAGQGQRHRRVAGSLHGARRLSRNAGRPPARAVSADSMTFRLFGSELASRDYFPLLRWMIFTGVTLFGFAIAWRYSLFQLMTAQDRSGISVFICILYVAISGHCLACVVAVSREINTAHRVRDRVMNGVNAYRTEGRRVVTDDGATLPAGRITDYIRNLVVKAEKQGRERRLDQTLLLRGLADKLRSPMQFGAFAGDALLKLGLLGTIVGFILMLLPLATLENFDAASMKSSMKVMSGGMAVAMYTTLAGLVGSVLVKAQYYILDNASAYLFDVTTDLTEVFVVSTLEREAHGGV